MITLSYARSLISEHRNHLITLSEAFLLADHFNTTGIEKWGNEQWVSADFYNETIEDAGYLMGIVPSHSEMFIPRIICLLFNYEQIG